MADGLSIAASVTGLLAVAGQISTIVYEFVSSVVDAPKSARTVLGIIEEMRMVVTSIQQLWETGLSRIPENRTRMVHINRLAVVFRESIIACSELENIVNLAAKTGGGSSKRSQFRWAFEEEKVMRCVLRLESHKTSLSAMLSILHCESDFEAQQYRQALDNNMHLVMKQNQAIFDRFEQCNIYLQAGNASVRFMDDDVSNICAPQTLPGDAGPVSNSLDDSNSRDSVQVTNTEVSETKPLEEFERLFLNETRVYQRAQSSKRDSTATFTSSAVHTHAWSALSDLSLSDISAISVLALPISVEEINEIGENLTFASIISRYSGDSHSHEPLLSAESRNPYFNDLFLQRMSGSPIWQIPTTAQHDFDSKLSGHALVSGEISNEYVPQPESEMTLYKLVVLGDGGAGKSALAIRFTLGLFCESYDPTIEDSYRKKVCIDDELCMVDVLDTAGVEEYTALRDQWIKDGEGFVIVYSISSRSSFARVRRFYHQVDKVKREQWEPASTLGPMTPLQRRPTMLVGNKCERVTEREVSTQEGAALAKQLGCQFVEVAAKDNINVEKAFFDVVRMLRNQRSQLRRDAEQRIEPVPNDRSSEATGATDKARYQLRHRRFNTNLRTFPYF